MQPQEPSRTAYRVAAHRAAHQILEQGAIFTDPFAAAILGEDPAALAADASANPRRRRMRLFVAVRSRIAEDALASAVARGVRQAVVLGAGFDTFGLRNPFAARGLKVFEVDHPATQAWKREHLARSSLAIPDELAFIPVDFERDSLTEKLTAGGVAPDQPTFFFWLGVVPYLRRETIFAVLRMIAERPASEVVFDYGEPLENLPAEHRAGAEALSERVAALGEPWISFFDPAEMDRELRKAGFDAVDDLGPADIAARFFGRRQEGPQAGPHVLHARRTT